MRTPLILLGLMALTALYASNDLQAQGSAGISLSGYLTESGNEERLIGATVVETVTSHGTSTNAFGFFSLSLPDVQDSLTLVVNAGGRAPYTIRLAPASNSNLRIRVPAAAQAMKEVVVSGKTNALLRSTQMSAIDLPIATIKALPAFLGEADVLKSLQLLPGVQAGGEGSAGLYVRGGGADQNLILLDGVPVYNASHLFGFFSVFNSDAIRNVTLIKGGFPARYGGRLSSVVDIAMKDGSSDGIHAEGGIGLLASRLTMEGPIKKGKSTFMISGRRTYLDLLIRPFVPKNERSGYYFYDLNAKATFDLSPKDRLYVSGYFGEDKFYSRTAPTISSNDDENDKYKASLGWGNATLVARWNHQASARLFSNVTAYYTRYRYKAAVDASGGEPGEDYSLNSSSGVYDLAARWDIDYYPAPNHSVKTGVGYTYHTYNPSRQQNEEEGQPTTLTGGNKINAGEVDIYAEDDIRLGSRFKANVGLHFSLFNVQGRAFTSLQPRLGMSYLVSDRMTAKASFARMSQFIHLLTNSGINLPTDLWVPATTRVLPEQSWQVAAGLAYIPRNNLVEITVEGYYKRMDGVLEYRPGASFVGNGANQWEDQVTAGQGVSYGAEVLLQKKIGRLSGLAGYTLSWTNRTFTDLNDGATFPYRYDRRHDIKLAAVYKLRPRVEVSADWVYSTGNAITIPIGTYAGPGGVPRNTNFQPPVYSTRNGYRMPAYHRGDLSVKFIKVKKRYERAWVLSIYNVYCRANPFFIYQEGADYKQVSLFRLVPSITYQFKF